MEYYTTGRNDFLENDEDYEEIQRRMREDNEKRKISSIITNLVDHTGVEKIRTALELPYHGHEDLLDIIMRYILNNVNFKKEYNSPYLFFTREIGFKVSFLTLYGADDPKFYEHSTLEETCENLIIRALKNFGYDLSLEIDENRFPSILNFEGQVNKFINRNDIMMYPFFTSRLYNHDKLMNNIFSLIPGEESRNNLYFHGTSWENSLLMLEEIIRSTRVTDFGRNCFYVSNYLPTAIQWAIIRNQQAAVIVFKMEDEWIENIQDDRKLNFDHINENSLDNWKEFVFNSRNARNNNFHYINGPILANSRLLISANEAQILSTESVIPYQTAVRNNHLCEEFKHIYCVLYFLEVVQH